MKLVRWKWLEMIAKKKASKVARQDASKLQAELTVRCECGVGRKEGNIVRIKVRISGGAIADWELQLQCNCCEEWQHTHCYGFLLNTLIDEHFCYSCLLEESDVGRSQELKRLTQFRRAIWLAYREDYPGSLRKFSKVLCQCTNHFDSQASADLRKVMIEQRKQKSHGG